MPRRRPRSQPSWKAKKVLPVLALALASTCQARTLPPRDFRTLSDTQLQSIVQLDPPLWTAVDAGHMEHLLVERVSGTEGNKQVQTYLSSVFTGLGWHEEKDTFTAPTPNGNVEFTNLVYTFDPDAPRKLVLAAHFDSKYYKEGGFIGATDSAAPMGTLIDVAEALTPLLKARAERITAGTPLRTASVDESEAAETTLQIILFDGEEAFKSWTPDDSVYGSRHLAEKWENTFLPDTHPLAKRRQGPLPTVLETMDVLVLLDLLGAPEPRFNSFYRETDWLYNQLASADDKLKAAGLVNGTKEDVWFSKLAWLWGVMDDDHRPFSERGVPILHVIPSRFPSVWHTLKDDKTALDLNVCNRWNRIMRVFTAGYLGLAPDDKVKRDELVRDDVGRGVVAR